MAYRRYSASGRVRQQSEIRDLRGGSAPYYPLSFAPLSLDASCLYFEVVLLVLLYIQQVPRTGSGSNCSESVSGGCAATDSCFVLWRVDGRHKTQRLQRTFVRSHDSTWYRGVLGYVSFEGTVSTCVDTRCIVHSLLCERFTFHGLQHRAVQSAITSSTCSCCVLVPMTTEYSDEDTLHLAE